MKPTKPRNKIQQDYREKAASRGLIQICLVVPIKYKDKLKQFAKQLRDEWSKTL